jgi:hypothetical protein
MTTFLERLRFIRDLFWPLPDPPPSDYVKNEAAELAAKIGSIPSEEGAVEEWKTTYADFLEAEDGRRQSVEGRLTNVMGLASIAGTIVFGTILAQIAGTLHISPGFPRWIVAIGSLYLVMQICGAIFAAVGGLSRQAYVTLMPADFLVEQGADKTAHLRGLVTKQLNALSNHQLQNDAKVTWMATAHRAMQQFLCGLLAFALIGTYFVINAPPAHDDLVETLKKNRELQELIRGLRATPAGQMGIVGTLPMPVKKEFSVRVQRLAMRGSSVLRKSAPVLNKTIIHFPA